MNSSNRLVTISSAVLSCGNTRQSVRSVSSHSHGTSRARYTTFEPSLSVWEKFATTPWK